MPETLAEPTHPSEEAILRWAAGQFDGTDGYHDIEVHLAACTSDCSEYLTIASAIADSVEAQHRDDPTAAHLRRRITRPLLGTVDDLLRQQLERLLDAQTQEWLPRVRANIRGADPAFLLAAADRALYLADERPTEVLGILDEIANGVYAAMEQRVLESKTLPELMLIHSMVELAEGVAHRTLGDHLRALESFHVAENDIECRPLSAQYGRICAARAASLRVLERHEEAWHNLVVAGQVFQRVGVRHVDGLAKVLNEMANVAQQMGQPKRAFALGRRAARMFGEAGQALPGWVALHAALAALITLRRPSPAQRLLHHLEDQLGHNPRWAARLRWKRGQIAALRGDLHESLAILEDAAGQLAELGSPTAAAQALLDVSHVAHECGDVSQQLDAAARAAALLSRIPGHPLDLTAAIERLRDAIRTGVGVAELVRQVSDRLERH